MKRAFGRANSAFVFKEAQLIDMHSVPFIHLSYGDKSFPSSIAAVTIQFTVPIDDIMQHMQNIQHIYILYHMQI